MISKKELDDYDAHNDSKLDLFYGNPIESKNRMAIACVIAVGLILITVFAITQVF